jgi:two-component system response regulator
MTMGRPCLYHIEDNEADRRLLGYAFETLGTSVELHAAADGEEALGILADAKTGERCHPDLVILDLNLPKYSGIEVLSRIRQDRDFARVKVVVLTSSDSPLDRSASEALGITAYVRKPMHFDDFVALGGRFLELARA